MRKNSAKTIGYAGLAVGAELAVYWVYFMVGFQWSGLGPRAAVLMAMATLFDALIALLGTLFAGTLLAQWTDPDMKF